MILTFLEPEMEIPEQTLEAVCAQDSKSKLTGTGLGGVNDV